MKTRVRQGLWAGGFAVVLAVTGCQTVEAVRGEKAATFPLQVSRSIPAATGEVKVKPERSGNQEVEVKVDHIAPPDLAAPGANVYVVWLTPEGTDRPTNVGVLEVNQSERKGEFKTSTPFKSFEVLVTPEKEATAKAPSKPPVLRAEVTRQGGIM